MIARRCKALDCDGLDPRERSGPSVTACSPLRMRGKGQVPALFLTRHALGMSIQCHHVIHTRGTQSPS